jgi:hypothetical protein
MNSPTHDTNGVLDTPVPTWHGPRYSDITLRRIQKACKTAEQSTTGRAWRLGRNPRTGDETYRVRSSSDPDVAYYPTVRATPDRGGFCYSQGLEPVNYIRCTCEAFIAHQQPCKHAARVHLRLEKIWILKLMLIEAEAEEEPGD